MNAMCIAHECEPYGHLAVNGKPMTDPQLARLVGVSAKECTRLLAELEAAGVPSRTDDGALYSRRMVNDERLRQVRAEGGKAGSEHGIKGKEHGSKGGRPPAVRGDKEPPLNPPPSSSSSSSSSEESKALAPSGPPPAAVALIPLVDKSEFPITADMVKEWESAYPRVDVLQTLKEIRAWNLTNPTNRKTRSGVLKHVNTWLAKEQNGGR